MVTSNKLPDKKVVKMAEQNSGVVVPQRTLLGEVNEHLACPLCRGYYIDATTIVECLHSFCRSCIIKHLQVKSYCPVCEMMINSAKPNIKLDKALQDIVYKLVPGLFQKEMERRQQFYASRPGPAASATPEQRGEDTERIIFSPEDVISFSLEYVDATDADSISSKSSDSNEPQPVSTPRRYLQCPAVVNVSHLKKFLSMKFDIDSTQFTIDILYKRVSLPDYYSLMDIAYIYNWKRNEPMRFFYQIIDYVAIRNRLFDVNRKGAPFRDRRTSHATTEDTNVSSPAPNINDQGSEASSGTDSPMPDDKTSKQVSNILSKNNEKSGNENKLSGRPDNIHPNSTGSSTSNQNIEDEKKSQFLISFELTAKNSITSTISSPIKTNTENVSPDTSKKQLQCTSPKADDSLKRKRQTPPNIPEMKKLKVENVKAKIADTEIIGCNTPSNQSSKNMNLLGKNKEIENPSKSLPITSQPSKTSSILPASTSDSIANTTNTTSTNTSQQLSKPESSGTKKAPIIPRTITSPQRKSNNEPIVPVPTLTQKAISPLKLQMPKTEPQSSTPITTDTTKNPVKKIPDLKPSFPQTQSALSKPQQTNKIRMDLLANNSDPTIDRSKILSQVKSSLGIPNPGQVSGDPLKTLFDSCKINIPSSLSITLTDQKQDSRSTGEVSNPEVKKTVVNKNLDAANSNIAHKAPSPPVHNYIEILKLPDSDPQKQNRPDGKIDNKIATPNKPTETISSQSKPPVKSSETTAKGPIPNLKPISDTKLAKQSSNLASPITFQQTFEQQLLQSDKKPKLPKTKAQVPKLVPANPKSFSAATKLNNPCNKLIESKPGAALDLTTPSNSIQSQLNTHQTKAFETMQSIANLARKQNLQSKSPSALPQSFSNASTRPLNTTVPIRQPSMASASQLKADKSNISGLIPNTLRHEVPGKINVMKSATNHSASTPSSSHTNPLNNNSTSTTQPSQRSQTRSPSSSPKLVIAEEKNSVNSSDTIVNQSNQISSTQLSNMNLVAKSELPKVSPGPSKPLPKPMKPMPSATKIGGMRQPMPTMKPNPPPTDFQLLSAHHAMLKHQMEMNWLKARQYMAHAQAQNEFNKDKK